MWYRRYPYSLPRLSLAGASGYGVEGQVGGPSCTPLVPRFGLASLLAILYYVCIYEGMYVHILLFCLLFCECLSSTTHGIVANCTLCLLL